MPESSEPQDIMAQYHFRLRWWEAFKVLLGWEWSFIVRVSVTIEPGTVNGVHLHDNATQHLFELPPWWWERLRHWTDRGWHAG